MDNVENRQQGEKNIGLEETIFQEKVRALYNALPSSVLATIVIAAVMVSVLWPVIDHSLLIFWFLIITSINVLRLILYIYYSRSETDRSQTAFWDKMFYLLLILTAISWSCVSIFLLPDDQSIYHYFPALVLVGISAGAVTSLSFSMRYISSYSILLLLPLFIIEVNIGTFISYSVAGLTLVLAVFSLTSAKRINQTITENITLHYDSSSHRDKLVESRNTAIEANSAKTNFISMISHELRTPLNGILGFAQLLKMSDQPPLSTEQDEQVNGIFDSGHHLLSLIEELLDLSKIESHKLNVSIRNVSLANVVSESVAILNPVALEYMIKIINNVKNVYLIKADEKRLKQVLINLISNAIKYNHENGKVTIDVSKSDNNMIRVSVSDNGDGLTEQQQKELFKPFTRYNDSKEGIGLGLYITQSLVELMHGNVGVESIFKKGSTFWFELPLAEENK